mgnify:CR=1 FL=1
MRKVLIFIALSFAIVSAQNTALYSKDPLNVGVVVGSLFLGAMSATQSDMFNTKGNCYQ